MSTTMTDDELRREMTRRRVAKHRAAKHNKPIDAAEIFPSPAGLCAKRKPKFGTKNAPPYGRSPQDDLKQAAKAIKKLARVTKTLLNDETDSPDPGPETNPDTRKYETTLQPRHWQFAENKAAAMRMTMPHYLEWLVRRDMQLDPLRIERANSRTVSGDPIIR